ncbi:hypothetical protein KR018_009051, partial [Drosophila ironensis]
CANFAMNQATATGELWPLYSLIAGLLHSRGVSTVMHFNPAGSPDCSWISKMWSHNLTEHPQIVWQHRSPYSHFRDHFSNELLVLACLSSQGFDEELFSLASSLNHVKAGKVLIEVAGSVDDSVATQILAFCLKKSMLNVELYFRNWTNNFLLFSYKAFPEFRLIKNHFSPGSGVEVFKDKMKNMTGHRLVVIPDYSPPNSFVYLDSKGERQMAGYLWDYMVYFAKQLNAGLRVVNPGWSGTESLESLYMLTYTANGSVDVGLTTTLITPRNVYGIRQYSYPIFYSSWCTMLPVEQSVPTATLFARVLTGRALLILLPVLVAISLAKEFAAPHLARLLPRLLMLFVMLASTAQLQSLLISPPHQPRISSFDDVLRSDVKILGVASEFYNMDGDFRAHYAAAFHLVKLSTELYEPRNHFNTSWAYTIPYMKWMVNNMQQSHFARPLFRYSKDLCFKQYMPTSVVLAPDSIYQEPLKDFSMRVLQAGLLRPWLRKSFYDMVKTGRMKIKDYSQRKAIQPLQLGDLKLAYWVCLAPMLVAIGTFVLELIYFYTNVLLNGL